jgi:hypothetical protein
MLLIMHNRAGEVDWSVYGYGKYTLDAFPFLYWVEQGTSIRL